MNGYEVIGFNDIQKNIEKLKDTFKPKELRKVHLKAATPLKNAIKAKVPVSKRKHYRYSKGGEEVASYTPGNLKRSIGVLRLRKAYKADVYVGPRVNRNGKGDFAGRRVDGWYAHFIEYGVPQRAATPFMRPAFDATKGAVKIKMVDGYKKLFNQYNPIT